MMKKIAVLFIMLISMVGLTACGVILVQGEIEKLHDDIAADVLGPVIIDVPQKEFEEIEVTGDFSHVSLYTINSDVLIHANDTFVYLDIEADLLEHNITLGGSESNTFRGVSAYLDKFPDNVRMDLNLIQGGKIKDPENILKENSLESGLGQPVISINNTKEIDFYRKE